MNPTKHIEPDGEQERGDGADTGAAPVSATDLAVLADQLGRPPRGVRAIAARCPSGHPSVVETEPVLPDGTPFPTVFYLTCPALNAMLGTLEAEGEMAAMTERLSSDPELAERYRQAHRHYLAHRERIRPEPRIAGVSAGGMPERVKCLHALVAHALAAGPGVNPLGDQALTQALARMTTAGHGRSPVGGSAT